MYYTEASLEATFIDFFREIGYTYAPGRNLHRISDRDVLLEDILVLYIRRKYAEFNLSASEEKRILAKLSASCGSLYETNRDVFRYISEGFIIKRDDPMKPDLFIELLDYEHPEENSFLFVNQLEIVGVGGQRRIPDGIVYINGIPLVVIEFKSAIKERATIHDAYKQLSVRYRRDIPDLFSYNAFIVISDGANNKYGSLYTPFEYFYGWNKVNSDDPPVDGLGSMETMMRGLFTKERLLAVIRNFIYFPDDSHKELKIVCRYPQFFAATKLYKNILAHQRPQGDGKGGTYFGATGCGKSYTMLFLTRMLMKSTCLSSPTVLLITDRTDLDDQLSKQFLVSKKFIGDNYILNIEKRSNLGDELEGRTSGGVFLTTIQKFSEDITLLTTRSNVICISDEAHRSQTNVHEKVVVADGEVRRSYGFAKYLHDSLPNATYVGFTGTPIDATLDVFGDVVDKYTMTEAVKDGITVNLVYDGRAAKVFLDSEQLDHIEDYYRKCATQGATDEQIEASKKAAASIAAIIGDPDVLRAVAENFVDHYETRVQKGASVAGKAMFVCADRDIAYRFYKILAQMRPEWVEKREYSGDTGSSHRDKQGFKPIERLKLIMTRDKDDEPSLYNMLGTKEDRKEFDRQFKDPKSNFKIAVVVDMWLTGFDVPELDTIYIFKPLEQHNLIQTISRVNRVCEGKDCGLIVDYFGIKPNMDLALKHYTDFQKEEFEGVEAAIQIVLDELEVIELIFRKFDKSAYWMGNPREQFECLKQGVEYAQQTEEIEHRFMASAKRMKQAYNLCCASPELSEKVHRLVAFYCAVRAIIFKMTRGDAPDAQQMTSHVQEMLEKAIQSEGVEEIFTTGKHIEAEIFSDGYLQMVSKIKYPNTKIKILERLLEHAIDALKKVNKVKATEFSKRMKQIVDDYNERRQSEAVANDVLDDIAEQLAALLESIKQDRNSHNAMGISYEEKAFLDILQACAVKYTFEYPSERMVELAKRIKLIVDEKANFTDWSTRADIKADLQVEIILLLDEFGYPPITQDEVYTEVLEQAENFKKNRP